MNEEEKKAMELLENIRNNSWTTKYIMSSDSKNAEVLLNLIAKQQKEIEELKEDNKKKSIVIIEYQDLYEKLVDKIKAKIEEVDENGYWEFLEKRDEDKCKDILQSLLEKE